MSGANEPETRALRHPVVRLDPAHGAVLLADPAIASTVVATLTDPRVDAYLIDEGVTLLVLALPATAQDVTALNLRLTDRMLTLTPLDPRVVGVEAAPWLQHPRVPAALAHAALHPTRQPLLDPALCPPLAAAAGVRRVIQDGRLLYLELDRLPDKARLGVPGISAATIETGVLDAGGAFVLAHLPARAAGLALVGRDGTGGALTLPAVSAGLIDHLLALDAVQHIRQREALGRLAVRTAAPEIAAALSDCQERRRLPQRIEQHGDRVIAALDLALPVGDALLVVGRLDPAVEPGRLHIMLPTGAPLASPLQRVVPGRPEIAGLMSVDMGLAQSCRQVRGQLRGQGGIDINLLSPVAPNAPDAARAAILAAAPLAAWTPAAIATVFGPALADIQATFVKTIDVAEDRQFGTPPSHPRVSVIVPLYHDYSYLRAQFLSFAADPDADEVELVYVLDKPQDRARVEHLLKYLARSLQVACRLIVLSRNAGYGIANNVGVSLARGEGLVLLNSDVVPTERGWIGRWWRRHTAIDRVGASGPRLLFADGSLQHAGLFFESHREPWWNNNHYYMGYPADFPPALIAREVPGITGACFMVERAIYRSVGGFDPGYVIADYEDSDLCLRLRAAGRTIHYDPGETLFHVSRSSVRHHTGLGETTSSRYNAWRQSQLWSDAIARLMAQVPAAVQP